MLMLYVGPLWNGSTALQRMQAFSAIPELKVIPLDSEEGGGRGYSFLDRVRHKLRWPADHHHLNQRMLAAVREHVPGVVFIDWTRLFPRRTLQRVRALGALAVYYCNDDVSQPHNSSRQLESCDREWDIFFTTKTFNVPELRARGVRRPVLIGNAYDPELHRPMTAGEVGPEFEKFDAVFVGTYEPERAASIQRLAEAGITTVIYGNGWKRASLHTNITLRPPKYAAEYSAALHTGKLALGFLRKINRDRITQRSIEVAAAQRPMLAEKTDEHDEHFVDGREYVSFAGDDELLQRCRDLLQDSARRLTMA